MEFKVWVEGIQRVICGVNETTTCQDIVVALANAVGKTGRFTLIEKWRENERFLAPTENPLKVVKKWGEYASDVQFILRHTDSQKHKSGKSRTKRVDKSELRFNPNHEARLSGSTNLKKSLTFSGGRSYSSLPMKMNKVPSRVVTTQKCVPENSSLESLEDHSSFTSHSSQSSTSPYASFENKQSSNKTPVGYGSLDRYRTTSNVPLNIGNKAARTAFLNNDNNNKLPQLSSLELASSSKEAKDSRISTSTAGSLSPPLSPTSRLPNGGLHARAASSPVESPSISSSRDELMKLVKLQEDKLSVQQSHMQLIDSEIQFWEGREQENQLQVKLVHEDLKIITAKENELSQELEELDLVSWEDKLDLEKQHEKTYEAELDLLRSQITDCETELSEANNKVQTVSQEFDKEKVQKDKLEKDQRDQELRVLQEISELQKQLNQRLVQYEDYQRNLSEVEVEVKSVDNDFALKEKQLVELEENLKAENKSFFLSISDIGPKEGEKAFVRPLRPGSARKLTHSPLLLKDFVATSKNPHGYWV